MNEQQLAAVKQALEALEMVVVDVKTTPTAYEAHRQAIAALQSIISQDALDWMAKNARELGLDYEPAPVQEPVFCEYCGGNDDADFGLPTDHCTDCARPKPDYAWPTIEDYEKEVGFKVNDAFKAAWTMARTTNDLFKQMGESA